MHDLGSILFLACAWNCSFSYDLPRFNLSSILFNVKGRNKIKTRYIGVKVKFHIIHTYMYTYCSDKERGYVLFLTLFPLLFFSSPFSFWVVMYTLFCEEDLFSFHVPVPVPASITFKHGSGSSHTKDKHLKSMGYLQQGVHGICIRNLEPVEGTSPPLFGFQGIRNIEFLCLVWLTDTVGEKNKQKVTKKKLWVATCHTLDRIKVTKVLFTTKKVSMNWRMLCREGSKRPGICYAIPFLFLLLLLLF